MNITVRLFAQCRENLGQESLSLDAPEGCTLEVFIGALMLEQPVLEPMRPNLLFAVNSEYADLDRVLEEGDEIAVIPPVSGGAFHVGIGPDLLDATVISRLLGRDENGGLVVFSGVVRRYSLGRVVQYLEYEAYAPMAEQELAKIGNEVCQKWGVEDIALYHRIGRLEIGEVSMVVAVSSPHRREAFVACQEAVDLVKERVPIWKKEFWEGGSEWMGSTSQGVSSGD